MKYTAHSVSVARPGIRRALCSSVLALAIAGCHESHIATTQVVVDLGNNQTAIVEVPVTQPSPAPATPESTAATPVATPVPATMPMPVATPAPATMPMPADATAAPATMPVTQQSSTEETTVPTTQTAIDTGTPTGTPTGTQTGAQADNGSTGSGAAEMSRSAGHGVAEASRDTYRTMAGGATAFGSSAVDIATNSARRVKNTPPESLSAPVIDVDEAMEVRDWDQTTATYKSGATVAGPIGFLYEPRPGQSGWRYNYIEIPLFLGNTALLPFAFSKTLPWKPVYWKAATVEPTYTAVPPLPAE